jgi:hypothetical protein
MNIEIGTETPIFLFGEYLFRNFGILSLQCIQRDSLDIDLDVQAGGEEEPVGADLVEPGGALLSLLVGEGELSPVIDSKESILPAYVAWRAGTSILFLLDS